MPVIVVRYNTCYASTGWVVPSPGVALEYLGQYLLAYAINLMGYRSCYHLQTWQFASSAFALEVFCLQVLGWFLTNMEGRENFCDVACDKWEAWHLQGAMVASNWDTSDMVRNWGVVMMAGMC